MNDLEGVQFWGSLILLSLIIAFALIIVGSGKDCSDFKRECDQGIESSCIDYEYQCVMVLNNSYQTLP